MGKVGGRGKRSCKSGELRWLGEVRGRKGSLRWVGEVRGHEKVSS